MPAELQSLRIAAAHLGTGARYFAYAGPGSAGAALFHATRLYMPDALPVRRPGDADWIVSYRSASLVPPGVVPSRVYTLAPGTLLVRVR